MRTAVAAALALASGIFVFSAAVGIAGSRVAAGLLAALAAALVAAWSRRRPPVPLDAAAAPRGLRVVSALATAAALVQVGRLAVFIVAPSAVAFSSVPGSAWELRHSCLSAYAVAAEVVDSHPNVYDDALYSAPQDDPAKPRKPLRIGSFNVDVYEYPPQFLLLPRALRLATPEFLDLRSLWFGLSGLTLLAALVAVARARGPAAGTRALLLSPLVWVALPTLSTLQKGNFQVMAVALSMLAMVCFARRRPAAGGALLAFMTVSKLFPGLLGIYLIARRDWRAVAWSAAFGVAFTAAALLDLGWAPFAAFVDHVPGLLSGQSFPALRNPMAMAINFSIPGLAFKLKLFGVPGMGFGAAKWIGWIYTVIATALVYAVGRRSLRAGERPQVWLAILVLATLRSPFLPQAYAALPPLWLLTLLAARRRPATGDLAALLGGWLLLNIYWPLDWPLDPRWLALLSLVPQALTIVLALVALRLEPEPGPVPAPLPAT